MARAPEVVGSLQHTLSTRGQHPGAPRWVWSDAPRWYVIQTKPHREERVIAHLTIKSPMITPFLPKIEVIRKRAGRRVVHFEPLFPSYLFVWMPLTVATWYGVRWTPGARRLLGDGVLPIAVPEGLVRTIRDRVEPLGFVRVGLELAPGARVRIRTGPFAGLEGIFERPASRQDRVRVLLEMLGAITPLEIDPLDLERV